MKELKRRLDNSASYIWVKDKPYSWKLINSVTLKTAFGCENRYSAEMLTRKLKSDGYQIGDVPREYHEDEEAEQMILKQLQSAALAILLLAGPVLWVLEAYGIF